MNFLVKHLFIARLVIVLCLTSVSVLTGVSQNKSDRWLRVLTDEDSILEVDRLSLVLEQNEVIRATFRTTFVAGGQQPGPDEAGYRARVDLIEFSVKDRRYRVHESKLLDSAGQVVSSRVLTGNVWKPLWGRTGTRLFSAAKQLQPFGIWKVVSYRYASGEPASSNEPAELTALLGSGIHLELDRVEIRKQICSAPIFEPGVITEQEFFRRVGTSLRSLGVSDTADAIYLRCKGKAQAEYSGGRPTLRRRGVADMVSQFAGPKVSYDNAMASFPPNTLILRRPDNRILILWEGVFLELERTKSLFRPESF